MTGRLLLDARKQARKFIQSGGTEEDIILTHPSGSPVLDLKGIHTKHWMAFDTDGAQINSKNAHILISEQDLIDASYVYRDPKTQNIDLKKHRISSKDSSGILKHYVINETYPSETFGLIGCILGDFKL